MIHSYKTYQAFKEINEAIEEIIDTVDNPDVADQLAELSQAQDDIFNKYNFTEDEVSKIKNSIEDTIKLKLGKSEGKNKN